MSNTKTFAGVATNRFFLTATPTSGFVLTSNASGQGTWQAVAAPSFASGTVGAPGIAFSADLTTGFYYTAASLNVAVSGTAVGSWIATGLTLVNGRTLNVGTSGTTSPLNVFGLITGSNGLTISSGLSSLQNVTAAGLVTASAGLTVATGQTLNVGTTGTTSPLNVFGLITGSNGLTLSAGRLLAQGSPSTTLTNAALNISPAGFTTASTAAVYFSRVGGSLITTTGGVPLQSYSLYVTAPTFSPALPTTGNITVFPYALYVESGITFLGGGIRNGQILTYIDSTPYTVQTTDRIIYLITGGAITLTLPVVTASNVGTEYIIVNRRAATVTLASTGGTFFGASQSVLTNSGRRALAVAVTSNVWFLS